MLKVAANRSRKKKPGKARRGTRVGGRKAPSILPIDELVRNALRGGRELLTVEDPLEAEAWASSLLGTFYKLPLPFDVRDELEKTLGPAIVEGAERRRDRAGLAVLRALAAVTGGDIGAHEAAERLAAKGVPEPPWATEIGAPEFLGVWTLADPYDDQVGYYLSFRYPGRPPHVLMALYDENLGGIIKDAFAGALSPDKDPRKLIERDPDMRVQDAEPGLAATRITQAIATGDLFVDNDWTREFKETRALLRARMRLLPAVALPRPPEPLDERARAALIQEFLASPHAPEADEAPAVVEHCLAARCDYGDGDPLRWSPTGVELFLLDYLPRKAILDDDEIAALPGVLSGWVRFALQKRGLAERFIAEAEEAVKEFVPEFRRAVSDPTSFGPAKTMMLAMRADGVDFLDQQAVDAWIADFNALPQDERDKLSGDSPAFPAP